MAKYLIIGAIIGAVIGWLMNVPISGGAVLGAAVGGMSYTFTTKRNTSNGDITEANEEKIQLKEEQLDIRKNRIQTGEVNVHKEVVEEDKTFTIPVKRQELVVEAGDEEEYRIPLKEEQIEINKQPVKVNEVTLSKRQVHDVEQVTETIKKEEIDVDTEGDASIIEEDTPL
ncbi:hypothetical protein CR194_07135 [Salipaludibacillus keqinensis]|uniref:DUF2382 domain-containing protein n=1 Tax=Salipaludibacillus keqinensis TaxID=2045207 RepID=A0A323TNN9_9BACI|nr:YsnF/AvaK domain-containing protein [Salipaludibacillus keqinensis]PYZ95277.1 hypothetical protein CR194_07135 [Salipaludibacillus keqinensis]